MPNPVIERIHEWYGDAVDGQAVQEVLVLVQQLADELFSQYEPTTGPHPNFWQRLDRWLSTELPTEQQKTLFKFIPYLFFVGNCELNSLYRVAFNGPVARWLIDQLGLRFDEPALEQRLRDALATTLFCPITDSMRINAFYHLNNIAGHNFRPDWHSLAEMQAQQQVLEIIANYGIQRIVLLEDFVGTGSQIRPAAEFAGALPTQIPVLLVPLIACPDGVAVGQGFERRFAHLRFSPVLTLDAASFLKDVPTAGEPDLFPLVRTVADDTYARIIDGLSEDELAKLYGPFGFRGTGGLIILWTNCPDNTLPLIHQGSRSWKPLFPRASRI
jgi:hypothetical protein